GDTVSVELHFEPLELVIQGKKVSTTALVLWASGGAVLAAGAVLGGLALGKADGAIDGTPQASTARGMATGADVTLALGAAAVVAGIVVQVISKKKRGNESSDVSVAPTPRGAALFYRKDF